MKLNCTTFIIDNKTVFKDGPSGQEMNTFNEGYWSNISHYFFWIYGIILLLSVEGGDLVKLTLHGIKTYNVIAKYRLN